MDELRDFSSRLLRGSASALLTSVLLIACGLLIAGAPAYAMDSALDTSLSDAFKTDAGALDDFYALDFEEPAVDSLGTDELPSGTPVDQDITYSHAESAESNGVTFTIYWDESQLGCETHFHIVCSGGSGEARARMDAPSFSGAGKTIDSGKGIVNSDAGDYQSYTTLTDGETDYSFTMSAYGTYRFRFYFLDVPKGVDEAVCAQVSISLDDPTDPSEEPEPEPVSWTFKDVDSSVDHHVDINWLASEGVSTGWTESDGTRIFRPYWDVARADMAAFLYRLAGSPEYVEPAVSPFTDVTSKTPHYKEICWLAEKGVSHGWSVSGGKEFRPYACVARCDMAAFLYRLAGSPDYTVAGTPFLDCGEKTPHYKEVCWLASTGVSTGWDVKAGKEFRAYASVARADMAAFLHRMHNNGLIADFGDVLQI